jgi:hypothetical protein
VLWKKEVHKQKNKDANKINQQTSKDKEGFIKIHQQLPQDLGATISKARAKVKLVWSTSSKNWIILNIKLKMALDGIWIYHGLTSPGFQISNIKLTKKTQRGTCTVPPFPQVVWCW